MIYIPTWVWVALGGALGTLGRYWLSAIVAGLFGELFPWGTLLINITGSFAIGFFATVTDPDGTLLVRPEMRTFFMIGICGGYTTFSSFSFETFALIQERSFFLALANMVGSVALGQLAVVVGIMLARLF